MTMVGEDGAANSRTHSPITWLCQRLSNVLYVVCIHQIHLVNFLINIRTNIYTLNCNAKTKLISNVGTISVLQVSAVAN